MKRLMQISVILALVLVLVIGTFPMALTTVGLPGPQPNVGWNTKPATYAPAPGAVLAMSTFTIRPCIGWNT